MNKFGIVAALAIGLGAVYTVYTFRTERLTASSLDEIENAQTRMSAAEQQASADQSHTSKLVSAAAEEKHDIEVKREAAAKALEKAENRTLKSADPNLSARYIDVLPPEVEVVPVESMPENAPDVFMVQFETTKGNFVVEVHKDWAPNGAARIYELIKNKFYTDNRVFRAVEGFVVQFGIPGDPAVSAQWLNKNITDDPVKESNTEGTFTFAAGGVPNTRSTQVFVNLKDNTRLDSMGFAPVGKVIFGMDVVKSLFNGYGEQPTNMQQQIAEIGNSFLDQSFPNLDSIKRAVLLTGMKDINTQMQKDREESKRRIAGMAQGTNVVSERAPDVFKVKLECSMGDIVLECHREWAPLGADRFFTLVKKGFYDECKFFRVVPDFVAQFGIPAEPRSNRDWLRSTFSDDPVKTKNEEGTITFAAGGKDSRTTQVFFNLKDNSQNLDPLGFAPFGKIVEGMEVAKKINAEYGEQPEQRRIRERGNEYLNDEFPKLDGIKSAKIVE